MPLALVQAVHFLDRVKFLLVAHDLFVTTFRIFFLYLFFLLLTFLELSGYFSTCEVGCRCGLIRTVTKSPRIFLNTIDVGPECQLAVHLPGLWRCIGVVTLRQWGRARNRCTVVCMGLISTPSSQTVEVS